jgi:hypothetical protein
MTKIHPESENVTSDLPDTVEHVCDDERELHAARRWHEAAGV